MCPPLSASKCSAHAHFFTLILLSLRAYCVSERRETHRKGKRGRVKAVVQVTGTNGSDQKIWLDQLTHLEVVT